MVDYILGVNSPAEWHTKVSISKNLLQVLVFLFPIL